VLVGWTPVPLNGVVVMVIRASLAATLFYGLSAVYAKRTFAGVPPLTMAIGQQAWAALVLMPPAAVGFPQEIPSLAGVLPVLALLSTAVAHLLYFRLITSVGPTETSTVTFFVPVFGVLWGLVLLGGTEKKDKPPTLRFSALLTEGGAQRLELMSS
jgi:drug/metabolite transporter (DMT)-like permease